MKSYFLALLMLLISSSSDAATVISDDKTSFDFRGLNVAQAVQLIYSESMKDAYVIDPDVLIDQRNVSFRYDSAKGELRPFIKAFFDSLGLEVTRRNGVDFVAKKQPKEVAPDEKEIFVYRPKHRSGSYLVDLLSPLMKGQFSARRAVRAVEGDKTPQTASPPGSAAASIDRDSDTMAFQGSATEIKVLAKLLSQVDVVAGGVVVRGVLYEVQTTSSDGSAFSLALNLLGGKLGVSFGPAKALSNSFSFSNTTFDAVLSSLSTDSRFIVKSTPTLRVQSGEVGRFTVGQDVPVLGSVSYSGASGAAVRSVDYRSSGVIFDLYPTVHAESVELKVMQQVSNFVQTDTGVNDSPTLIKRELKTTLSMTDGELVVIGGLAEDKETNSRNGLSFIPSFFHTKSKDKVKTEILLILQLTKV
ncbi:general secretion pathway protein D [Janthinobacterium sp. CG_23.3]|uniref:type II secretion system protein GspD n=1 Tax=Janthinobacterium sp. CG_23.3 TaxID=3349634 RepID=UPI0038D51780